MFSSLDGYTPPLIGGKMTKRMTIKDVEAADANHRDCDKAVKELIDKYIAGLADEFNQKIRKILKREGLLK